MAKYSNKEKNGYWEGYHKGKNFIGVTDDEKKIKSFKKGYGRGQGYWYAKNNMPFPETDNPNFIDGWNSFYRFKKK